MKLTAHIFLALGSLLATALLAAQAARSTPAEKPAGAGAAVDNSMPQSVFVVPQSKEEGRDPFFPTSIRTDRKVFVTNTNKAPVVELICNGRSGTPERPLVIINNTTFAVGDTNTVATRGGRVQVICRAIREDSVEIEINGERKAVLGCGK